MVFTLNKAAVWILAMVFLTLLVKVGIKVIRVLLGRDEDVFDIRKLPEFLAADVLAEVGGLLVLSIVMFLEPTDEMPVAFGWLLGVLQAAFVAAGFALAGKYVAKITDQFPKKPPALPNIPEPSIPEPGTISPAPGSTQPSNPPVIPG